MSLKETLRRRRWQSGYWQPFHRFVWSLYSGVRILTRADYRAEYLTARRYAPHLYQFSTFTQPDRYPDLFA